MTKTVVVHAGHLLDVKIGKTLANQTILIQGDKIASVGSDAQVPQGRRSSICRTQPCCRD